MDSELDSSDEEPHLDRGGGTERLGRRVMATYVATPSHEKTYPSACANDGCCCQEVSDRPITDVVPTEGR